MIPALIILLLIIVNGYFVAAEFAIAASPRTRVAQMAESGSSGAAHVLSVLSSPDLLNRYISTAQVGITIASLGLGMYGEHVVAEWLLHWLEELGWFGVSLAHTLATIVAVALLTYLHVVLGEMVPKSMALQSAAGTAVRLSRSMSVIERLFRPLTAILNWLGNAILRLVGVPTVDPHSQLVSADELAYIVDESSEGGLIDADEQVLLENAFDFHGRTVGQVMTPRTTVIGLMQDAGYGEVMDIVTQQPHSRYPIFSGDQDHVAGFLHIKDLACFVVDGAADEHQLFSLDGLSRPAAFVPETVTLDDVLTRFRKEHIQIAVVVDEYGGTAGIVTLEDLAEELIGEIQDEFDSEVSPVHEIEPGVLRVRGDLLLDELTQHYELQFPDVQAETVGGFVMEKLGRIAEPGDRIAHGDVSFTVQSMQGLAVDTVRLTLDDRA